MEYHRAQGNHEQQVYLELFRGTLANVVRKAREEGRLDDWLLALSHVAGASSGQWRDTCVAYAQQLVNDRHHHKAASFLIVANKVRVTST